MHGRKKKAHIKGDYTQQVYKPKGAKYKRSIILYAGQPQIILNSKQYREHPFCIVEYIAKLGITTRYRLPDNK